MNIEQIAEVCHEAVRNYKQQIGDYSLPKWCEADNTAKELTKANVRNILKGEIKTTTTVEELIFSGITLNLGQLVEATNV